MSVETLARFLLLPELKLIKSYKIGGAGIAIKCEKVSSFEVCPKCARKSYSVYDRRTVRVRDEPIRGKAVILFITKRRFFCSSCKKPFTEPVPGIGKGNRTTERFRAGICWAADNFSDLTKVQKNFRCSADTVYRATYEQLDFRLRKRTYPLPEELGIDEHSLKKPKYRSTVYATILVDHKNRRVYELLEGRNKEDLEIGLEKLVGKERVKRVTMDLSPSFRSAVKEHFINAEIIADRFHVQRLFTKKVNKYRKSITGDKRNHPMRKLLLRNAEDLEPFERRVIARWLNSFPELKEIYEYKEAIRRIYKIKGYHRAKKIFLRLCNKMGYSKNRDVIELRKTLISWREEILNYHRHHGMSNGRVEGFNRKAKLCQRSGYGYKKFGNYRLKLLKGLLGSWWVII